MSLFNKCLLLSFVFIQTAFSLNLLTVAFSVLFLLLVSVFFLREEQRMFIWMIAGTLLGQLIMRYIDRLVIQMDLGSDAMLTFNQLLWVIPLVIAYYVLHSFRISFVRISVKQYSVLMIILFTISYFITYGFVAHAYNWVKIVIYASTVSTIQILLWFGVAKKGIEYLGIGWYSLYIPSLLFATTYYTFSFSFLTLIVYFILGHLYSVVSREAVSLAPAIGIHFMITLIDVLMNKPQLYLL